MFLIRRRFCFDEGLALLLQDVPVLGPNSRHLTRALNRDFDLQLVNEKALSLLVHLGGSPFTSGFVPSRLVPNGLVPADAFTFDGSVKASDVVVVVEGMGGESALLVA